MDYVRLGGSGLKVSRTPTKVMIDAKTRTNTE